MSKRKDDMELFQQIYLGGQVSAKHKDLQEMARFDPDTAFVIEILKHIDEWDKLPDTPENHKKVILEILEIMGQIEFIRYSSELTRLSMILGDTRGKLNFKGVMDELRQSGSNP